MKKNEVSTTELFEAIGAFSNDVARQFADMNKRMATKEDLKTFATKEDLKAFATKEDLNEVKEDLNGVKSDLSMVKEDLNTVKEDVSAVKEDTQKILQLLPSLVHKEDRKVNTLVERLVAKRVFARAEVADILDTHPLVP